MYKLHYVLLYFLTLCFQMFSNDLGSGAKFIAIIPISENLFNKKIKLHLYVNLLVLLILRMIKLLLMVPHEDFNCL